MDSLAQGGGASATTTPQPHACNCIGCCPKCGTCRTWSGHTENYCALLQRQAYERSKLLAAAG